MTCQTQNARFTLTARGPFAGDYLYHNADLAHGPWLLAVAYVYDHELRHAGEVAILCRPVAHEDGEPGFEYLLVPSYNGERPGELIARGRDKIDWAPGALADAEGELLDLIEARGYLTREHVDARLAEGAPCPRDDDRPDD